MKFSKLVVALQWIAIDESEDTTEIHDYLRILTSARAVPRVFIKGKFFRGGDATVAAAEN